MAIAKTVDEMKELLMEILLNLEKASGGNRAASQRCRKCTLQFARVAKVYRKESVAEGRKGKKRKVAKKKTAKRKTTRKKATARRKPARKKTTARRTVKRKTTKRRR